MTTTLNFKSLLLTTVILVLGFSACKKQEARLDVQSVGRLTGQVSADATVKNTGDVALDGCGWVIKIGDVNYSPTNLADVYKVNELKVTVSYETLASTNLCGLLATQMPQIKLVEIKRR